jgi:citrate synthase
MPEGLLWLLLTGEVPTKAQVDEVQHDLASRAGVPEWVTKLQLSLPKTMHPMTQFNIAINALQTESLFAKAYQDGVAKSKYWDTTYEDSMNLIAKLPTIASTIYRHTYKDGQLIKADSNLDWSGNFAKQLGYNVRSKLLCLFFLI